MKKHNIVKSLLLLWGVLLFFLDKHLSLYSILFSFGFLFAIRESDFKKSKQHPFPLVFSLIIFCTGLIAKFYNVFDSDYSYALNTLISSMAGVISHYLVYYYIKTFK